MLQSDPVPESQAPVASDASIFDILKGNRIMTVINTDLVPIMIATEGTDFYDKNNTEKLPTTLRILSLQRNLGVSRRTHYLGRCVVERSN